MSVVDDVTRRWVPPVTDWFVKHVANHEGGQIVESGIDHHGGLEWVAHWELGDLDRYLVVAILPTISGYVDSPGQAELWAEAGNETHYTRRLIHSETVSHDYMATLNGPVEKAIELMFAIRRKDLVDAVPVPLWRSS